MVVRPTPADIEIRSGLAGLRVNNQAPILCERGRLFCRFRVGLKLFLPPRDHLNQPIIC